MVLEQVGSSMQKKVNLHTDLTFFMKINGKWTKDTKVKAKTVKLLEDNRKDNLGGLWFGTF